MIRSDRLAALGRTLADERGRLLVTSGTSESVDALLRAGGAEVLRLGGARPAADGALLIASSTGEAETLLTRLTARTDARVWLLSAGPAAGLRRAADRAGWIRLGNYAVTPDVTAPTHLVQTDLAGIRQWFADTVRPAWGPRSRIARVLGRLPGIAALGFRGHALLLAGPQARSDWVLSPDGRPPAMITLGGGPTAGRLIMTFAGSDGRPVCHVKVDPADRVATADRERAALRLLRDDQVVRPSVPVLLGVVSTPRGEATALSHLDGLTLERRWERLSDEQLRADVDDVLDWLVRLRTVRTEHVPVDLMARLSPLAASVHLTSRTLPGELTAALERGAALAALLPRLVHGDLWAGNIVRGRSGLGVIDWESAHVGHPLTDAIAFLLTSAKHRMGPDASLADAAIAVLARPEPHRSSPWTTVGPALRRILPVTVAPAATDVEDLVLAALGDLSRRSAHGEDPQGRLERWTACLLAVWQCWSAEGSPWRVPGPSATRASRETSATR